MRACDPPNDAKVHSFALSPGHTVHLATSRRAEKPANRLATGHPAAEQRNARKPANPAPQLARSAGADQPPQPELRSDTIAKRSGAPTLPGSERGSSHHPALHSGPDYAIASHHSSTVSLVWRATLPIQTRPRPALHFPLHCLHLPATQSKSLAAKG